MHNLNKIYETFSSSIKFPSFPDKFILSAIKNLKKLSGTLLIV